MTVNRPARLILVFFASLILYSLPLPEGLAIEAWRLLSIFVGTLLLVMLELFPMGAASMMGLTAAIATNTLTFEAAFNGFLSPIAWLVLVAFFISYGFSHTGLGRRIAYLFIVGFGKNSLGLAYGMGLTDLILSPGTPSSTARTGGIIYPLVESISRSFGSAPNCPSSTKLGNFLVLSLFHCSVITSTMFMTAMAANPFAAKLAGNAGLIISWADWALYASVPGLVNLVLVPIILYKLAPPEIKETPHAVSHAKEELHKLGKMNRQERYMAVGFSILMVLWIIGPLVGVSAVLASLLGLCFLLITNVFSWNQLLKLHSAFETFIWFGALMALAEGLSTTGFTTWLASAVAGHLTVLPAVVGITLLVLIYHYSHYFFASCTAHVGAMLVPFLGAAIALGAPALPMAFALCFSSSLMGGLTHYGNGPAAILFGSGYVGIKQWWKIGFYMSIVSIVVWVVVGGAWWWVLGAF
jgi:DASS family divalent anion:Na+ symporter